MEWIKCSDRLPEENYKAYHVIVESIDLNKLESIAIFSDGKWEFFSPHEDTYKVIYWIDLPPIPKE